MLATNCLNIYAQMSSLVTSSLHVRRAPERERVRNWQASRTGNAPRRNTFTRLASHSQRGAGRAHANQRRGPTTVETCPPYTSTAVFEEEKVEEDDPHRLLSRKSRVKEHALWLLLSCVLFWEEELDDLYLSEQPEWSHFEQSPERLRPDKTMRSSLTLQAQAHLEFWSLWKHAKSGKRERALINPNGVR